MDVVESQFKWPTNAWPKDKKHKEIGLWNNENMSIALESLTMAAFTRAHGWTREEVTLFLAGVRKDMNNSRIHAYWPMYVSLVFPLYFKLTVIAIRSTVGSLKLSGTRVVWIVRELLKVKLDYSFGLTHVSRDFTCVEFKF